MGNGHPGWRRTALLAAAAVVLAGMGAVLLWPAPVDRELYGTILRLIRRLQGHGLPVWVDYQAVESLANVLLYIPLGMLAAALLPVRRWWLAVLLCAALTAGVEGFQDLFLPGRQGDARDVLLNSCGALLGAAAAAAARWLTAVRRRRRRAFTARRRTRSVSG